MRPVSIYYKPKLTAMFFDGVTNYLETTQGITAINSPEGIISCWAKRQIGDRAIFCEAVNSTGNLVLRIGIHEVLHYAYADIRLADKRLFFRSARNSVPTDNQWHHFLFSWDTNRAAGQKSASLYIDDKLSIDEKIDSSLAFIPETSTRNWRIGTSIPATSLKMKMAIAQLYIELGKNIDGTQTTARRQWLSPYKKPVYLSKNKTPQVLFYFEGKDVGEHNGTASKFTSIGTFTTTSSII